MRFVTIFLLIKLIDYVLYAMKFLYGIENIIIILFINIHILRRMTMLFSIAISS